VEAAIKVYTYFSPRPQIVVEPGFWGMPCYEYPLLRICSSLRRRKVGVDSAKQSCRQRAQVTVKVVALLCCMSGITRFVSIQQRTNRRLIGQLLRIGKIFGQSDHTTHSARLFQAHKRHLDVKYNFIMSLRCRCYFYKCSLDSQIRP
jgi:hypothetical protein